MTNIIKSLLVIVAVAAVAGGATYSYFSDTETSTGNTFTAGTIDLKVDGNDDPNITHITMSNMKPGDGGTTLIQRMFVWSNTGSLDGQPWIEIKNVVNKENGCGEPEGDTTCGDLEGELGDNLMMKINGAGPIGYQYPHCMTGGVKYDEGSQCTVNFWSTLPEIGKIEASPTKQKWTTLPANTSWGSAPMVLEFEIFDTIGNIIQGDSVEFDVVFHLDQI